MILRAIDPDEAYCWRCGAWLPGPMLGNSDGNGDGDGDGWGNGWGDGYGNGHGNGDGHGHGCGWGDGHGSPLPLCDDTLACAIRQAGRPA